MYLRTIAKKKIYLNELLSFQHLKLVHYVQIVQRYDYCNSHSNTPMNFLS